jgi:hypothetical protein
LVCGATAVVLTVASASVAAPREATRAVIGTLQKIEGLTLTLQTPRGTETVTLSPSAEVRVGSRVLGIPDLASHTGARVKVRYIETAGHKEGQSVTVASMKKVPRST